MSKLFAPLKLGSLDLSHRIAMAPLTRYRADDGWAPLPIVAEYYAQRASTPGTLLVSEAMLISLAAADRHNVPGIWTDGQIAAWRAATDAVHARGARIFCQLWHPGRSGNPVILASHGHRLLAPSAVPIDATRAVPEAMSEADIATTIADYAAAARNAVERAGFDGVEVHGANGYLPDQFLQDMSNQRDDGWGGSIEGRSRFVVEVASAVAAAVGAHRTAVRLSPYSDYQGMLMAAPLPQFGHVVGALRPLGLAYLHLVEGRISGQSDTDECGAADSNALLMKIWDNVSLVLLAGGFTAASARDVVDRTYSDYDVVVVFGRHFLANPDLVFRLRNGLPLTKYDRPSFYTPKAAKGYVDYPFNREFLQQQQQQTETGAGGDEQGREGVVAVGGGWAVSMLA
ncbi:NADH:flavin oxidoreductase/NADH oxidase [Lasiosphaeria miniovina]|uniref:NADH:flavin oxidoreductase/NADH oxidase n=1 Tax=Lasiosphaeria miniovina TaxID=1954250 RepID=A0AA40DTQ3_9PEZI|nr:NADH:flavin oxidoreductase/NADH oxidase [Lasiosphaeria miniovina]KAK0713046.1 NADH:flavin oxidoreductase/NADH oxidase [Lasiosphaeria miniovina]